MHVFYNWPSGLSHTCIFCLSMNILCILWYLPGVVCMTPRGHSFEFVIYVQFIVIFMYGWFFSVLDDSGKKVLK